MTHLNREVAQKSNDLFLCIKPINAKEVCQEIQGHLKTNTVVVSVMAAVPLLKIKEWLKRQNVVKTMPTMSVLKGPVTLYNPLSLHFNTFSENYITVDNENTADMSTTVSGCMPGFLANIFEQWIDAAVKMGMNRQLAEQLICANASAFADFNVSTQTGLQEIQKAVASKGGATEKGLINLNESNLNQILGTTMSLDNNKVLRFAQKIRDENSIL